MSKRSLPAVWSMCPLWFALLAVPGCATNGRFLLDPLSNKGNGAATDPLRGGNAMAKNDGKLPGAARLMPPDTTNNGTALTSAPVNEFKPLGANVQSPTLGALAANTRPKADGSPFAAAKTAPLKQAQWSAADGSANTAGFNWEQAKAQLRARGVTWQQLEQRDGQWTFRCSLPSPDNPSLSRTCEATAADDLSAIRQVLESLPSGR